MPIQKPRRLAKILTAAALVAGASALGYHAVSNHITNLKPKVEELKIVKKEPLKVYGPEFVPNAKRLNIESSFYGLFNQTDLATKKMLSKDLRKRYFYEHIDLYENYFDFIAKQYNLDSELFRYIFFRTGYNLENPGLASDLEALSKIFGQKITRQDILDDPFLSIDLSAKFLDYLIKSKNPKDKFELLTYFRFGNVSKKDLFSRKLQVLRDYKEFKLKYDSEVKKQKKDFRAKAILNKLVLPLKKYKMLSLDEFQRLDKRKQKQEIENFVRFLSPYLELPSEFMLAIIDVESGFNHKVVSPKNAIGLMQLKLDALEELDKDLNGIDSITGIPLGKYDLFNPYMNIVAGMLHFKYLVEYLDSSYESAFMAYNMGLPDFLNNYPNSLELQGVGKRYLDKVKKILKK